MRRKILTSFIKQARISRDESLQFLGWLEELQKLKELTVADVIKITCLYYFDEKITYVDGLDYCDRLYFYPKVLLYDFNDDRDSFSIKSNGIEIIITKTSFNKHSICIDFDKSLREDVIAYAGINQLKLW